MTDPSHIKKANATCQENLFSDYQRHKRTAAHTFLLYEAHRFDSYLAEKKKQHDKCKTTLSTVNSV